MTARPRWRPNAAITSAKRVTIPPARVREPDDRGLDAGLGELAVAADVLLHRRRSLAVTRLVRGDHPRGSEVGHVDLGGVAALGVAVLVQHAELVADRVGSPNKLHASAWRATSRRVRRSPEPPTRIGMCSCSGRG